MLGDLKENTHQEIFKKIDGKDGQDRINRRKGIKTGSVTL
jgi:hypothetical protein